MTAILRRKRLPDGTFGELEKVFDGETAAETVERLESENAALRADSIATFEAIAELFEIIGGGA